MAWWRRRRESAQAGLSLPRQATWIAPAFPPEVDELVEAAFPSAPAQQAPVVHAAPVVPAQPTAPAPMAAVRLGFDDGSELHLPAEDPRARALQAVADLLVKTGPPTPTTNAEPPRQAARRTV
jgi:hypothetical protein